MGIETEIVKVTKRLYKFIQSTCFCIGETCCRNRVSVLGSYCYCCLVAQSCPTLCNPIDYSRPGSSVHGISQARILEWVAILFSRGSSRPRDQTQVYCIAGIFFIKCVHAKSLESFLTLCNPMDHSPPGSSVHGIIQARILECVAMPSSRGSSQPRDRPQVCHVASGFFTI